MNDIRRTILWVIFGFSMVLLWDQWQVYNGHKATFSRRPRRPPKRLLLAQPRLHPLPAPALLRCLHLRLPMHRRQRLALCLRVPRSSPPRPPRSA